MIHETFLHGKIMRSTFIALSLALLGGYNIYAQSVANSPMRHLSRGQFVNDMFAGWNLGNTMDGSGTETATPTNANANVSGQIAGPVRVGIFATATASRRLSRRRLQSDSRC